MFEIMQKKVRMPAMPRLLVPRNSPTLFFFFFGPVLGALTRLRHPRNLFQGILRRAGLQPPIFRPLLSVPLTRPVIHLLICPSSLIWLHTSIVLPHFLKGEADRIASHPQSLPV